MWSRGEQQCCMAGVDHSGVPRMAASQPYRRTSAQAASSSTSPPV